MSRKFKINKQTITQDSDCFFVAEIGANHCGSVEIAKKLIDLAKLAGCDYVKFQKRDPDIAVPEKKKNQNKSKKYTYE